MSRLKRALSVVAWQSAYHSIVRRMPLPLRSDAPAIDQLTVREITEVSRHLFERHELPGLTVSRTRFPEAALGKTLESEWGLALHIEFPQGHRSPRYLLDFGFTPDVYANNWNS